MLFPETKLLSVCPPPHSVALVACAQSLPNFPARPALAPGPSAARPGAEDEHWDGGACSVTERPPGTLSSHAQAPPSPPSMGAWLCQAGPGEEDVSRAKQTS